MDEIVSEEFYNDLSSIIESARKSAYQMADRMFIRSTAVWQTYCREKTAGTHANRCDVRFVSELA